MIPETMINNNVKFTVSLQGNIAAGKTSFFKILKTKTEYLNRYSPLQFIFADEPLSEWDKKEYSNNTSSILDLFYHDKSKYAFQFQINAFTSRLIHLIKAANNLDRDGVLITERSMISDRMFFENLKSIVTETEYTIYQNFYDVICKNINSCEKVMIYFNTTPQLCYDRIIKRARGAEQNISLDYLKDLDIKHREMIVNFKLNGGRVIEVTWPTTDDIQKLSDIVDKVINLLLEVIDIQEMDISREKYDEIENKLV
jgi:deoxyadenosine/deoxycytidine kinase